MRLQPALRVSRSQAGSLEFCALLLPPSPFANSCFYSELPISRDKARRQIREAPTDNVAVMIASSLPASKYVRVSESCAPQHLPKSTLARMFHLCSLYQMPRIDKSRIAEALLAAPGWARVGISDPTPWMREDAAIELANEILRQVNAPEPEADRQRNLIL